VEYFDSFHAVFPCWMIGRILRPRCGAKGLSSNKTLPLYDSRHRALSGRGGPIVDKLADRLNGCLINGCLLINVYEDADVVLCCVVLMCCSAVLLLCLHSRSVRPGAPDVYMSG
jgi:hypothetical protein